LQAEVDAIKGEVARVWKELTACDNELEELKRTEEGSKKVLDQIGDLPKILFKKWAESDPTEATMAQLRKSISELKEQLAQQLCKNARLISALTRKSSY